MNEHEMDRWADAAPVLARITALAKAATKPLIIGLCGPQGSGKSTLVGEWERSLAAAEVRTVTLSIDDFYLTRAEREALSYRVHPLFITRGVPGTHDVGLAMRTIAALGQPGEVVVPRFDKAHDDRAPADEWPQVRAPVQVILLEGWCVGAVPQSADALALAVNDLERHEDVDGTWRRAVNDALADEYQSLFSRLDYLVLLAPPGFEVVYDWRREQEEALRKRHGGAHLQIMGDAALARFIQHYERLTRHILAEMPSRADAIIELDSRRSVRQIRWR